VGDSEWHYNCGGEGNNICGYDGSQAVPASPSGKGEACMRDFSILIFKEVGVAAMGRNFIWH
jgi:hypothetical protein